MKAMLMIVTVVSIMIASGCSDEANHDAVTPVLAQNEQINTRITPLQSEGLRSVLTRCRVPQGRSQCITHELRKLSTTDREAVMSRIPSFMLK